MDIHLIPNAAVIPLERDAVDGVLGPPATGWEGADRLDSQSGRAGREVRELRHLLLPVLHAVQDRVGFISEGALNYVCQRLTLPPAEVYGVASFYALLALEPRPPRVAHVCDDIVCRLKGGEEICGEMAGRLGPAGAPALAGSATWIRSPCLGLCEQAPAVLIQQTDAFGGNRTISPATVESALEGLTMIATAPSNSDSPIPSPPAGERVRVRGTSDRRGSPFAPQTMTDERDSLCLLRRVGRVDPESLDDYRAHGGYAALRAALEMGPEAVIREVLDSRLQGRGGAAFPTGRKWQDVARAPVRPHYLVCNADESEPGTFKDRVIMEEDPFAVIEAMTIGGYATDCERGYIYIRGEYPLGYARLQNAMAQARKRGFLGDDILGSGWGFEIEVRRGAGAYICGEETALFNSIEGYRGEPRNKPPFPTQSGLFHKPTVINNVETLINVLDIVLEGGVAFAVTGTEQSAGTKLFCLSGAIARPGLYEVPFGTTLRELLELAGGVADGRSLRAVLLGGAASGFVTPDEIDVPLTFEGTRAIGAALGSGVVVVFDDSADMTEAVQRIVAFFRDESCGQCVPCRVGTVRQEEALHRMIAGKTFGSVDDEVQLIDDMAQAMRDASICGLGQTASIALLSGIRKLGLFARRS